MFSSSAWTLLSLWALSTHRDVSVVDATYSMVATDADNRLVGGAGCTCIPNGDVYQYLYVGIPNRGVLHTQARVDNRQHSSPSVRTAVSRLQNGGSLSSVLQALYDLDTASFVRGFDRFNVNELRQYGVANFNEHAGFTGSSIDYYYRSVLRVFGTVQEDDGGQIGDRFQFHGQGNIVVSGTVASMKRGFQGLENNSQANVDTCDLAGRLMASMQAVANANQGDKRCMPQTTGTSAFLTVDNPDGSKLVEINVVGDGSFEPIDALFDEFMEWRAMNPCEGTNPVSDPTPSPTRSPVVIPTMVQTQAPVTPQAPTPAPTNIPTPAPTTVPTRAPSTPAPVLTASAPTTPAPVLAAPAPTTPAPVWPTPSAPVNCGKIEGCLLEDLQSGITTLLTIGSINSFTSNPATQYSIYCGTDGGIDSAIFMYDGDVKVENFSPYYMGGDSNGNAYGVSYLKGCGKLFFTVQALQSDVVCTLRRYELEAMC